MFEYKIIHHKDKVCGLLRVAKSDGWIDRVWKTNNFLVNQVLFKGPPNCVSKVESCVSRDKLSFQGRELGHILLQLSETF